jgi:hypothetical protein
MMLSSIASAVTANEEPVFAADGRKLDGAFGDAVVSAQSTTRRRD